MSPSLPSPSRALIVGIDEYDSPTIGNLSGAVADARAVAAFCEDELGMGALKLRVLTSPPGPREERATRAAIVAGLREWLAETPTGEEALFYYSGHGSTTALDPAIQYGSKQGETLVPGDARTGNVLDLLDRELRVIVAELLAQGIRLTLAVDACHSGDVFRQDKKGALPNVPAVRLTPPGRVVRDRASLLDGTVSQGQLDALYTGEPLPYTLIAGCLPDQQSFEIPVEEGGKRGVMTVALLRVLAQAGPELTYRELGRALRANVPTYRWVKQHPHVAGVQDRALFSATEPSERRSLFGIQAVTETGITLNGGETDGVLEGSELTAFADWTLGVSQGRWRVSNSKGDHAEAVLLEGAAPAQVGQPLRLDTPPNRPTVFFDPNAEQVAGAWRKRDLLGSPFLVESARPAADFTVRDEGGTWSVWRADGSEVAALRRPRDNRSHFAIARELDGIACFERFRDAAPAAGEQLAGAAIGPTGVVLMVEWVAPGGTTPLAMGDAAGGLPARAVLRFTVANRSGRSLFVNLYRLDPDQSVAERLWPADGTEQLASDDTGEVRWTNEGQPRGPLPLKLIVSTRPLDGARWPCGQPGAWRGAGPRRTGTTVTEGWAVAHYTVGTPL